MTRRWAIDVAERAVSMFVLSFLGLLIASGTHWVRAETLHDAAVSAGLAALVVIKGAFARRVGDPDSAALIPLSRLGS